MRKSSMFVHDRRAIAGSINSVIMLLIMCTVITIVLVLFVTYNSQIQKQLNIDQAKSQEQITITAIGVNPATDKIDSITINNTGTTEVKIRALYSSKDGQVTILDSSRPDPSNFMSTFIPTGKSLTIPIVSGQIFDPQLKMIAATEKGTRTIEDITNLISEPGDGPDGYDPNNLYAGPLSLDFTAFLVKETNKWPNPSINWKLGGTVTAGATCVWKITVTNIGDRDITLNADSSFTTVRDATVTKTWFVDDTSILLPKKTANEGTPVDIIFVWDNADRQNKLVSIYPQSGVNCMIYLTFFGQYEDKSPYAQTIPFEATRTV